MYEPGTQWHSRCDTVYRIYWSPTFSTTPGNPNIFRRLSCLRINASWMADVSRLSTLSRCTFNNAMWLSRGWAIVVRRYVLRRRRQLKLRLRINIYITIQKKNYLSWVGYYWVCQIVKFLYVNISFYTKWVISLRPPQRPKIWGGTLHSVPPGPEIWGGTRLRASLASPPMLSWCQLVMFFKRSLCASTRGNSFKLAKLAVVSERDKNFFTNRVINIWNSLPDKIVTSSSVSSFKKSIAQFDLSKYLLF